MIAAQRQHRSIVIRLICQAFKQDPQFLAYTHGNLGSIQLIAKLAFETCIASKTIYLSDDLNAVALCKPTSGKILNLRVWSIQFLFPLILGVKGLLKLMRIESALAKKRLDFPNGLYIWMIATQPEMQGKGIASQLLREIDKACANKYTHFTLETSKPSNIGFYKNQGYVLFDELKIDADLTIYFMKKHF